MVDLVERRRQVGVENPCPLGAQAPCRRHRSPRSRHGSRGPAGTRNDRGSNRASHSGSSALRTRAWWQRSISTGIPSGLSFARFDAFGIYTRLTATGCPGRGRPVHPHRHLALASEVKATSPSIPAVLRPALRCVTCRTLTSVFDRLRSISFCRFLTLGQSCSCAALKIRCRSRRTSPRRSRQSMASQAREHALRSVHLHRVHRRCPSAWRPNLPFGSGGSDRIASKAHLPTSAPFRVRAAARYPAGYAGRPAEGRPCCPGFPSPYGAPAFASWASCSRQGLPPSLPPAYRRRLTAPGP